jgi:CubicO group peptidase (beta-lactamase class C family)
MLIRRAVCRPQDLIGATRMKISARNILKGEMPSRVGCGYGYGYGYALRCYAPRYYGYSYYAPRRFYGARVFGWRGGWGGWRRW